MVRANGMGVAEGGRLQTNGDFARGVGAGVIEGVPQNVVVAGEAATTDVSNTAVVARQWVVVAAGSEVVRGTVSYPPGAWAPIRRL